MSGVFLSPTFNVRDWRKAAVIVTAAAVSVIVTAVAVTSSAEGSVSELSPGSRGVESVRGRRGGTDSRKTGCAERAFLGGGYGGRFNALARSVEIWRGMKAKILVVDDDPAISEMLSIVLEAEGFDTVVVTDGAEAVATFEREQPDLILLDLMLPGMNGIDICKTIRRSSPVPIVMLTAKTDTIDIVLGLESGADDYVTKPFKPKELVARVRARLRRSSSDDNEIMQISNLTIDVPSHTVRRGNEELQLTPLEFDLLVELGRKPGQVFTREELLEKVWGYKHASDTRLVNVHVQRLRSKIETDPENPTIVLTVRGVGYKVSTEL